MKPVMKLRSFIAAASAACLLATALPASADFHRGPAPHWRGGGDIRHFNDRDYAVWRGGRWYHGWHGGHMGWWWLAAGGWYYYGTPAYPYPDPYTPTVVVVQPSASPAPQPAPVAPPAAATTMWYYCQDAGAYYPYVATCPGGWQLVSPTPPQ